MEVSYNIISIMECAVQARIGQLHPGYSTNGEQEDKANGPQHGCAERN